MIHNKAEIKHHLFNSNYCNKTPAPTFQFSKPPALTVEVTHSATGLTNGTDKGDMLRCGGEISPTENQKALFLNKPETPFTSECICFWISCLIRKNKRIAYSITFSGGPESKERKV